jgi:polysaccharide pyruvyl transferase WcaK-like protein
VQTPTEGEGSTLPSVSLIPKEEAVTKYSENRKKVTFFGHFGQINFGNESTLQAILYHLRCHCPDTEVLCICTNPEAVAAIYNVNAVAIEDFSFKPEWLRGNAFARLLRKVFIGVPSELYRWFQAFQMLKGTDVFIVPGTGLLTDAFGQISWGPYAIFKWSLTARLRRCKLLFVSVGAGPLYSVLGRCFIKWALSLAHFRSYRDRETLKYLTEIGLQMQGDRVFPDLAFSLPVVVRMHGDMKHRSRRIVGLGLMEYAGKLSTREPNEKTSTDYLENLSIFVKWLLSHDYDVRLLIGDVCDRSVTQAFKTVLKKRSWWDEQRILEEPVCSVEQLMSQIAATDLVVATRFHNVLFALLLNKPTISISFHQKCTSLMSQMGLSEYCQDIHHLNAQRLIHRFCSLEDNAESLRVSIRHKTEEARSSLDEQYARIFGQLVSGHDAVTSDVDVPAANWRGNLVP